METTVLRKVERNAETIKLCYDAFNAGDLETVRKNFHKDITWDTPGKSSLAGVKNGVENVIDHLKTIGKETQGTFRANLDELALCEDERVVGIHNLTAKRNGKNLNEDCCMIFEFKDGKVYSGKEFGYDLYAWDEFWK